MSGNCCIIYNPPVFLRLISMGYNFTLGTVGLIDKPKGKAACVMLKHHSLRAKPQEYILTGNLEATNCTACTRKTRVASETIRDNQRHSGLHGGMGGH